MSKVLILALRIWASVFSIILGIGFMFATFSLGTNIASGVLAIIMMMCGIGFILIGLFIWDVTRGE